MSLIFNTIQVVQTSHQNHLGLYFDDKLNFNHIVWKRASRKQIDSGKKILVLFECSEAFFPKMLFPIYKSSARRNVDYCDLIIDVFRNIEKLQYSAALFMTAIIKATLLKQRIWSSISKMWLTVFCEIFCKIFCKVVYTAFEHHWLFWKTSLRHFFGSICAVIIIIFIKNSQFPEPASFAYLFSGGSKLIQMYRELLFVCINAGVY